ncbi:hypothetical protein DPMN_033398 [Dreissena polymorpha]|uniref:Uncharacterized protein n=1 Tax=Dreissena polymorpha TaxID=45954 RepID=A0A9D4M5Z0_DREPO|nr:hypothetical protein DPMN_033398 [Dreissena polymorpha]
MITEERLRSRIMKLYRYIDHDSQMTPIDFQVTRYIDHDLQMTPIDFQVPRLKTLLNWLLSQDNNDEDVVDKNDLSTQKQLLRTEDDCDERLSRIRVQ